MAHPNHACFKEDARHVLERVIYVYLVSIYYLLWPILVSTGNDVLAIMKESDNK